MSAPDPRRTGVFAAVVTTLTVGYASYATCSAFGGIAGYDRCSAPGVPALAPFLLVACLPSLVLSTRPSPGTVALWLVYLWHVVSTIVSAPFYLRNSTQAMITAVGAATAITLIGYPAGSRGLRLPRFRLSETQIAVGLLALGILVAIVIQREFPFGSGLPTLDEIYARRAMFKNTAAGLGGWVLYVVLIAAFSVAPLSYVLGLGCWRRGWRIRGGALLAVGILLSLLVFNAAAYKSVALLPVAVLVLMLVLRRFEGRELYMFFGLFGAAVILLALIAQSEPGRFLFLQLFRRTFLSPGINTVFFIDYFGLAGIPGVRDAPGTIAQVYYGMWGSANSGLLGDGVARGGLLGVGANLILLWVYLRLMDAVSTRLPLYLSAAVFLPQAYALSNSGTLTVAGSYGLVTSLAVVYLLNGSMGALWAPRPDERIGERRPDEAVPDLALPR